MVDSAPADPERNERLERLRICLSQRLFCPLETVRPESRLTVDLGADSLDFVDLMFQLESQFDVAFEKDEFFLYFKETTAEGYLKPDAVERLATWIPEMAAVPEGEPATLEQLVRMITVESLLRLVETKLPPPST